MSFLIIFVAAFLFALLRGYIVLGVHHRELMAHNARELAAMEKRSANDEQSIAKFADAAARSTTTAEVQQAIVNSIRQLSHERRQLGQESSL